jgi:hypothetical protein
MFTDTGGEFRRLSIISNLYCRTFVSVYIRPFLVEDVHKFFPDNLFRRVAELFEQRCTDENEAQNDSISAASDTIPFQEKVADWFAQEDTFCESPNEPESWTPADGESSHFERYRDFVSQTTAYSWLLSSIRRELTQTSPEDDLLKTIRDEIWRRLSPVPKISIRRRPHTLTFIFKLNWNPKAFILEQQYPGDPAEALERAITLTGSPTAAQALPCLQYLDQVWPSSGNCVARLLQKLMRVEIGQQVQGMTFRLSLLLP